MPYLYILDRIAHGSERNNVGTVRVTIMLIPGPSPGNKPPGTRDYLEIGIFQREIKMEIACRKTGKIYNYMVKTKVSDFPISTPRRQAENPFRKIGSNSRSP